MAREFGKCWSLIVAVSLALVQLGCKEEMSVEERFGLIFTDTLPPIRITDSIIEAVINKVNLENGFQNIQGPGARTTLDYVRIKDRWFAALIMRRDESQGLGRRAIGKAFSNQVQVAYIFPSIKLDSTNIDEYTKLIESDSAWVYFDDYGFWNEDENWSRLFEKAADGGKTVLFLSRLKNTGSEIAAPGPLSEGMWMIDVSILASKVLKDWVTSASHRQPQFTGIDYLATDSNWFATIIVHRVAERVVYSPIVGEHFDDSLLYRHLYGEPIVLEGDSVAEYMNLYRSNNLWTLINNGEWESDEAGIRQLWHNAGEGKDSSAITRKLTFPLEMPSE